MASAEKPTMMPAATFSKTIRAISPTGTCFEISTGMSSSDVERNTASSVPTDTTPPA